MVDASGSEGRDPLEDIEAINKELVAYNADLTHKKQFIAANKVDLIQTEEGKEVLSKIHSTYEAMGIPVFEISAATGLGIKELLYAVNDALLEMPKDTFVYAQEFDPETELSGDEGEAPYTITYNAKANEYVVEGPKIEKMLTFTNLESEKGFAFFQNFMKENLILEELKKKGIQEGDTVRLYGHSFEYYDE